MKILQITSNMKRNGPALVVYDLASGLRDLGHEVTVASVSGELTNGLEALGVTHLSIPIGRITDNALIKPFRYLYNGTRTFLLLEQYIVNNGIDIINSHQPIPNILARLLSRKHHIPFVTTSHNIYPKGFLNKTYVSGDYVVAVSEKVYKNSVSTFGASEDKMVHIPNGINLRRLRSSITTDFGDSFVVGTVAGLRKQKALHNLIEAFFLFHQSYGDSILVIAGEGTEFKCLQGLTESLGIESSVIFLGFRSDIANILTGFDLFALPSEYEGLPIAMLEAMALKVPVVATAVGGIPEVISNGKNGYTVPFGEPKNMAQVFETLYKDDKLRRSIAQSGFETIKRQYSNDHMAKRYEEVYRLVCYT